MNSNQAASMTFCQETGCCNLLALKITSLPLVLFVFLGSSYMYYFKFMGHIFISLHYK